MERFDLQLEAFVSLPGSVSQNESESLVTRDISMCGAFLKTDSPPAGWIQSLRGYDSYAGGSKKAERPESLDQSFRKGTANR